MLNTKVTCGSLLHSSSPSVGLLHIYLRPWYPLILNSTGKKNSHPWGHLTSLNQHTNTHILRILNLGVVVYSNLFLYTFSSWNHQSLFHQCCFLCHFAKVCTLQCFPPYSILFLGWYMGSCLWISCPKWLVQCIQEGS